MDGMCHHKRIVGNGIVCRNHLGAVDAFSHFAVLGAGCITIHPVRLCPGANFGIFNVLCLFVALVVAAFYVL